MELVVIPKVMHDDSEKVKDVVVCLPSVKRDSDFALCIRDRADDSLVMPCNLIYNLPTRCVMRLRY